MVMAMVILCEIDSNGWDGDSMVATGDCDDTPVTTDLKEMLSIKEEHRPIPVLQRVKQIH